jgi:hypothetical protein
MGDYTQVVRAWRQVSGISEGGLRRSFSFVHPIDPYQETTDEI